MAQIIDGGNLMFKSLMYGRPHPGTMQFIENQMGYMSQSLSDAGRRFVEEAQNMYAHLESSNAMRAIRSVGRAVRSLWQLDEIRELNDIGQLQHAPLTMQRWVMAQPQIRSLFHQQRLDGYSDSYVDLAPGQIGEEHYDYRRVMDGMVVVDETPDESGEFGWTATTYLEELLPEDSDLMLDEQQDILATWGHLLSSLERGKEDPTSKYNADLG
jgi:hypothetical protein